MTKLSDYWSERRNDPDRQEDRLAAVIIGAVAVVIIVLLLLILWRHLSDASDRESSEREADEMFVPTVHEEEAAEYMAQNDEDEAFRQEYLASIEALNEKVEQLLETMTQAEQSLSDTITQYQKEDAALQEQITKLHAEVSAIVINLKETQTKLYDLTDIVQVMDQEKIPLIQKQILEIRNDMQKVHSDIANLHAKIAALEQEDVKLWAEIGALEKTLQNALHQNMTEVNNQFDVLLQQLETVENRIGRLAMQTLRYRYDEGANTLYLEPYGE